MRHITINTIQETAILDVIRHNMEDTTIFVCSSCFNDAENCTCGRFEAEKIEIDKNMQEILKNLNAKNYKTVFSCESHFNKQLPQIYIKFVKDYDFSFLPDGFSYKRRFRIVEHLNRNKKPDKFEAEKQNCLKNLLIWSEKI